MSTDTEKAYWDERTSFYEVWSENPVIAADHLSYSLRNIEPCLPLHDGAVIVDLGVGIGRLAKPLAEAYPSVRFIGVDISEAMLIEARRGSPDNLELLVCDGRNLPIGIQVDGAYSMVTFQHMPREAVAGYIEQLRRIIKAGGVFRFQFIEGEQDEFQSHHFTRADLEKMIGDDFEIERYQTTSRYADWRWVSLRKSK